jgi:N-acetylglucosaminyl-diphospho-decaprenol L-rhamnosyltransferase
MSSVAHNPNMNMSDYAPEVVVAIVNYCTPDLVIDCLKSLAEHHAECPTMAVVVADNASPDGSAEPIARAMAENGWSGWAELMVMPHNGGFGYANNAIIQKYLGSARPPRYFWLLNSDTIVRAGAIATLLDFMARHPDVGVAGSRLEDPDGTAQHSAFRFPSIAAELESSIRIGVITRLLNSWRIAPPIADRSTSYDWLSGASMLISSDVLRQIGLFDEAYFLYYEETDLCLRLNRNGWRCCYVPDSRVVHLVGKSTGVTERNSRPKRRPAYWFESRRRFFVKHHGRFYAFLADLALAAGTSVALLRSTIQRRPSLCPERFLYDLARHSPLLHSPPARINQ